MKKLIKRSYVLVALTGLMFASSCSVEYRARHPRPKRVIVVGQAPEVEKVTPQVNNDANISVH